jgi:hypothetical protein
MLESIEITRNLDEALRHLRHLSLIRRVWIDALCINQGSIKERNLQVAIMGQIYLKAACVVIWTGPEQDKSQEALALLQRITQHVEFNWSDFTMSPRMGCKTTTLYFSDGLSQLPYHNGELTPVSDLFNRSYFKRVWIRQEVALATRAVLHCGDSNMDFQDFRNAIGCLRHKSFWFTAFSSERSIPGFQTNLRLLFRLCEGRANHVYLRDLRLFLEGSICEDPRDKLFAMTAMMTRSDGDVDIRPDYSKTTEKIYTAVAERVILQHHNLNILKNCHLASRVLKIPSWAPDWSSQWQEIGLYSNWSACSWITSERSMLEQGQLHVAGFPVSRVETVIERPSSSEYDKDGVGLIIRTLRKLAPSANRLEAQSLNGRQWAERFCRTTLIRCYAESYQPRYISRPLLDKYVGVVESICFSDITSEAINLRIDHYMRQVEINLVNLCQSNTFFTCSDGRIGITHIGVRKNDLVSVLFNAMYPVLLRSRPDGSRNAPERWEVVSIAVVGGLMQGEAIYGSEAESNRRPVYCPGEHTQHEDLQRISNIRVGMYDCETETLSLDPAAILEKAGIKVERYQRDPHRLEVLPETLRAAGIPVQDFILV